MKSLLTLLVAMAVMICDGEKLAPKCLGVQKCRYWIYLDSGCCVRVLWDVGVDCVLRVPALITQSVSESQYSSLAQFTTDSVTRPISRHHGVMARGCMMVLSSQDGTTNEERGDHIKAWLRLICAIIIVESFNFTKHNTINIRVMSLQVSLLQLQTRADYIGETPHSN